MREKCSREQRAQVIEYNNAIAGGGAVRRMGLAEWWCHFSLDRASDSIIAMRGEATRGEKALQSDGRGYDRTATSNGPPCRAVPSRAGRTTRLHVSWQGVFRQQGAFTPTLRTSRDISI